MFRIRNAVVAVAVVVAMLAAVQGAWAQTIDPNAKDEALCRKVLSSLRPSTGKMKLDVVSVSVKIIDDERATVTYVFNWHGRVTNWKYQSRLTVHLRTSGKAGDEVTRVAYVDDGSVRIDTLKMANLTQVVSDNWDTHKR